MQPTYDAYLASWAAELTSQKDRVRNLIGDAHWLSDGHHKEALIRHFIREHLPATVDVASGFVCDALHKGICSPEIDILVTDTLSEPHLFRQHGLCICVPASVLAHMQIKSAFETTALNSALTNVSECQRIISSSGRSVWRGVMFFSTPESRTTESIVATLVAALSKHAKSLAKPGADEVVDLLPTCIACIDQWVAFVGIRENSVVIKVLETDDLSAACVLVDLFDSVRARANGKRLSDLSMIANKYGERTPIVRIIEIKG